MTGDIERARIALLDAVVGADSSSNDNSPVETRAVERLLEHVFDDQVFEVKEGTFSRPP